MALIGAMLIAGCGNEARSDRHELIVFAASSLAPALDPYASGFAGAEVKISYGGSDELAAQIRQGLIPDVYAAADDSLPADLEAEGLITGPVAFASNELALAVTRASELNELSDLAGEDLALAIGAPGVPIGNYAREALDRLPVGLRDSILSNVATEESSATGIVAKLTQGAVDAGFVYETDAAATPQLRTVRLPRRVRIDATYIAAPTSATEQTALARSFIAGLVSGTGRAALREAGFGGLEGG